MRKKFNRYERRENQAAKLENALHGEGLYVYENPSQYGDLTLPRPTASGVRTIGPKQQFQGDNYYMQMVKSHDLRLIREIVSPEAERKMKMDEQKLILDQPDKVTNEGKVEQVVVPTAPPKNKKKNETNQPKGEVLINEDPMSGVEIIME